MIDFEEILGSAFSKTEKASRIAKAIRQERNYPWVGIYDVGVREIRILSYAGATEPAFTFFPKDKGLNGRAVVNKQTIMVNDTSMDDDYLLTFTTTKSEIIVPVFDDDGKVIGTIDAEGKEKDCFSSEDAEFLENCAKAIRPLWNEKTN